MRRRHSLHSLEVRQMKRLTDWLILFWILTLAPIAHGSGNARLRIAITGDPQNYFTREDSHDAALFQHLLDLEIDDIIAYHPDFAIIAGDLTDSTGGSDSNGTFRISDDPNDQVDILDAEWSDFRTYIYNRRPAAGIPVFLCIVNHESCVDF